MNTKLTLRLDEALIKRAKARARLLGKSLSQMVSDYFALLNDGADPEGGHPELPPLTRSLKGALRGGGVDRDDYLRYLDEKHR
jgi:hypothetical protein